jgi:hypothetical protein
MREQVYDHLLKTVDMELPEKLSATQAGRALEGRRVELLDRGMPLEEVEKKLAEIRADSEARSRDRLKLFFIMWRLGDDFKTTVSEQEVNGRVAAMAIQHGQRPDQLRAELARTGRLSEVGRMLRDEKTADRVIGEGRGPGDHRRGVEPHNFRQGRDGRGSDKEEEEKEDRGRQGGRHRNKEDPGQEVAPGGRPEPPGTEHRDER